MADLFLPIVVSVIAVLIALGAQWVWGTQGEGLGRPNLRIAGLGSRWAEKVRAVRMRTEAPAASAKTEDPAADAARLVASRRAPRAGDAEPRAREDPSEVASSEVASASSTRRHPPHEPASAERESPKPAKRPRGHSTIAVDPLEVPLDPHHARVAAGALIHDLEIGKIGRPR